MKNQEPEANNDKRQWRLSPVTLLCRCVRIGVGIWAGTACAVIGCIAWMLGCERASDKMYDRMLKWQELMEW